MHALRLLAFGIGLLLLLERVTTMEQEDSNQILYTYRIALGSARRSRPRSDSKWNRSVNWHTRHQWNRRNRRNHRNYLNQS